MHWHTYAFTDLMMVISFQVNQLKRPAISNLLEASWSIWCGRHTSPDRVTFLCLKKKVVESVVCVAVSIFFNFHPYLGKMSNLTNIFQTGWNHQPVVFLLLESESVKQTQHIFLNPPWSSTASLPLKRHQNPKGKDRLPVPSFFRGC